MAATISFINKLLNAAYRGQTYTGGTITIGLFRTGLPSTSGVEVSGGQYARQELAFSAASNGKVQSNSATFTDLPTGQQILAYGVFDGGDLLDEAMLSSPYTPDLSSNELTVTFEKEIGV